MPEHSDLKKRRIRPLPERLVNKIAAGEVIERPAAVLKELIENSYDAGATQIEIIIEKSGAKLISVIDNGCGIPHEQVEIAFSRHATSKISNFDDLENLRSFGFRGEALPSVGSVSKTRLVTKTSESETGTELIIEGGVVQSIKPVAAPEGTRVEVADLFYNTPARRKFLKSEATEARHLSRNAVALALSAPEVNISCRMNGRKLFAVDANLPKRKMRVAVLLLGKHDIPMFEVISESSIMNVQAFLCYPDQCRQNRNGMYLFINNRFISSLSMFHAVIAGYGELLPKGNFPVGAIFLEVDPLKVDVNVHPTKAEVRLSDERAMHDILYQAVKRTIRGSTEIPSTGVSLENAGGLTAAEAIKKAQAFQVPRDYSSAQTNLEILYGRNKSTNESPGSNNSSFDLPTKDAEPSIADDSKTDEVEILDTVVDTDQVVFLGQLADLYLLYKLNDQILIIDQHTAHERILYEENIKLIESGGAVSQNLLFPINIDLSPDRFSLLEEAGDMLGASGFIFEPFGGSTILLNAVPTSLSNKSPEKVFNEIIEDVENLKDSGQDLKKAVAQSVACRAAIMAGDRLSKEEAVSLFIRLFQTANRHCCPHGRPTILRISKDELDAKFGRK